MIQHARQLRHDMTESERRVWQFLRERQADGFRFRRQVPIGPYIADFACLDARLVVEIDGSQHGDERDVRRERWLREQGFRVSRFWNNEVASNIEGVYARISSELLASSSGTAGDSPWSRAQSARSAGHPHPNPSPVKGEGQKHTQQAPARSRDKQETRIYGLNACLAAFAKRPEALRKVYLTEARIAALQAMLAWCVKNRLGYRVVEETDLDKLTGSRHHEGVCCDLVRPPPLDLGRLLATLPEAPAPSLLLMLDRVGNPHNLGALLRSAAHFGVGGVVVPANSGLDVSGAAARVAEGAAEVVPVVQVATAADALYALRLHGYTLAATVPRAGTSLYAAPLPARLVLIFGAEGEGMSAALIAAAQQRLTIPGSGAIDSLNVAASVAVVLGEYWRQHGDAT